MQKITVVAALSVALLSSTDVYASLSAGDFIKFQNNVGGTLGTGNGGEFLASYGATEGSMTSTFLTFCVEDAQTISNNTVYKVHSIIPYAVTGPTYSDTTYGGLPADTLGNKSAWLFLQFHKIRNLGIAADGGFTYITDADANNLQNAIWWLESNGTKGANNTYVTLANNQSVADLNAALAVVRVVNPILKTTDGTVASHHVQSMLVVVNAVPEASTIAIWSVLSLVGASVAYRKRNQLLA